jgi:DNA-binding FadR family transcriptional regulator
VRRRFGAAGRPRVRRDPFAERLLADMERLSDPANPEERATWSDADRRLHRQIGAMTGNPVIVAMGYAL